MQAHRPTFYYVKIMFTNRNFICMLKLADYHCIPRQALFSPLGEGKKNNPVFYGRTDSKKLSVGRAYFFLNNFFKHFLPKLPEKIGIFSCSLPSKFFIQIFVQKMADFTIFGCKKKQIWEKAVGWARKTGFSFHLGLISLGKILYLCSTSKGVL